jgi:hypothetical protein
MVYQGMVYQKVFCMSVRLTPSAWERSCDLRLQPLEVGEEDAIFHVQDPNTYYLVVLIKVKHDSI